MSKLIDNIKAKRRLYLIGGGIFILIIIIASFIQRTRPKPMPKPKPVFNSKVNEKNLLYKRWMTKNGVTIHEQQKELKNLKQEIAKIKKQKSKPPVFTTPNPNSKTVYPPAFAPAPFHNNFNGGVNNGQGAKYSETDNLIVQQSYTVIKKTKPGSPKSRPVLKKAVPVANNGQAKSNASKELIPPGSFVKAVLLTGADVPTGSGGQVGPLPVLLRVTSFAQLPNFYKTDIKSCFVVGTATAQLAAERAYIKVTHLSCVTKKGQIISKSISGTVTGVDGNEGLAGKVVSKQGAMLARVLVAGFLQGVGQAFQQSQQNISISPLTGGAVSQPLTPNTSTMLSYGIGGGVSQATQKLADFYMKLANQMFPVVVIHAGRPVNIIFLKGIRLPDDFKEN
jgi:conjugal transfer pilus assembly protein TraB